MSDLDSNVELMKKAINNDYSDDGQSERVDTPISTKSDKELLKKKSVRTTSLEEIFLTEN